MIAHHMENETSHSHYSPVFLGRIAAGDQAAFREIYTAYYKRLYQFALAIVKTREPAEEIVEDVFIRIWQKRAGITAIQNIRVYLYTATKNTALNYLSRKARESITESFDHIHISLSGSSVNPEQVLITAEMFRKIQQAVEDLPPRCKMIFKLVREDGLQYKEVAAILNISVNTIDVQMAIAVRRIGLALEADLGFRLRKKPVRK